VNIVVRAGQLLVAAVMALGLAACTDKAKPYLESCTDFATKGDLSAARDACENATKADPTSSAGKAATEKIQAIDKQVADSKAAAAAALQKQADEAAARAKATGKLFEDRPELILNPPYEWMLRARAVISDPSSAEACPSVGTVSGDEFAQREAKAKALDACKNFNETAKRILATCPIRERLQAQISKYDFQRHEYEIEAAGDSPPFTSAAGVTWIRPGPVLKWPGAFPASKSPHMDQALAAVACQTGGTIDSEPTMSRLTLSIQMNEDDAKALRTKIDSYKDGDVQILFAYDLDGKVGKEAFACGTTQAQPQPTGSVLAWRLVVLTKPDYKDVPLTGWIGTAAYEPSDACKDAPAAWAADAGSATASGGNAKR
jgi:hypothetical protein